MYQYRAKVVRVVDGDTVDVDIDQGFDDWKVDQRIRLSNFDAPETRTRDLDEKIRGLEATAFLETLIQPGDEVVLDSREYRGERGKYGRIIGDLITAAGASIRELMIAAGHEK